MKNLHINQVVKIYFSTKFYGELNTDTLPLLGVIRGIHYYSEKMKYDIELFWENNNGEEKTRIYNVDEFFVVAA